MTGIDNKVIAITGAASGIGEATALLLAERAKVVLGDLNADRLATLSERIEAAGGNAASAQTDVTRRGDLADLVALAHKEYGQLDVLVSNAGIMPISPLDDLRVDEWDAMIDVNIKGVLHGIAAALPVFRSQQSGHFVNIASTAAYLVLPAMSVYAGTKLAVRPSPDGLRQEAGNHLRVTVVTPGMTQTNATSTMTNPQVRAHIAARQQTGGLSPSAIARAIAFAIEQPADVNVSEVIVRPTLK